MKYVGTYSDPKDIVTKDKLEAVASRVSTNEDNIAMAESDIDGLQTTVGTLQTNVNNVQTALTSKQDKVVGGASTITEDNLTANRALVSNSSGKVAVSTITSTELGYLDGVTSNVQTQLNKKLEKAPVTSVNSKTGAVELAASDVGAVSKTGDTMTGNLTVGSASLQTNGYVTGTWLKTTADTSLGSAASKIAVLNDGWVYSRTTAQIKSDIGLGNVDNVKQYSASNPPPYPVTSVNGHTGAVTVTASDVGAATTNDIHTAINRTNAVNVANSNYTTYMARGEALFSTETTPTVNGCIAWVYG